LGLSIIAALLTINLVSFRQYSEVPEPVYVLENREKAVYLTFNVLWPDESLYEIAEILDIYEVSAVFFLTGEWLEKHPEEGALLLHEGHELGFQGFSRQSMLLQEENSIREQLEQFKHLCLDTFNYHPLFFRPPYGEYNARIVRTAKDMGYTTLLWNMNPCLIPGQEIEQVLLRLEERLQEGAVLLFPASSSSIEVLTETLDFLTWKGYDFGSPENLYR